MSVTFDERPTPDNSEPPIRLTSLTTDHLRVPLGKPGRVSLTDPAPAGPTAVDVVVVRAETDAGLGPALDHLARSAAQRRSHAAIHPRYARSPSAPPTVTISRNWTVRSR
jgi:hypothetical protein